MTIRERVGYRGLVLLWLGWIFLFIGLALIPAQPPPTPNLWHTNIGLPWRVTLWIVPGVVGIVAGGLNAWHDRWPRIWVWQLVAFALLTAPPATRLLSFAYAAGVEHSWVRAASALVYAAIVVGVLLFAAWPEPQKPRGLTHRMADDLAR